MRRLLVYVCAALTSFTAIRAQEEKIPIPFENIWRSGKTIPHSSCSHRWPDIPQLYSIYGHFGLSFIKFRRKIALLSRSA